MLRKALTLGMVFIFALSLLAVSMITCFTYDAQAHNYTHPGDHYICYDPCEDKWDTFHQHPGGNWQCTFQSH